MKREELTPSQLMELSRIVESMVNLNKITKEEGNLFLEKAGLTVQSDNEWIDTVGTVYTFL